MTLVERLDRFQRAHPRAGLPLAVAYKFFDDQGSYLAALIAYYGLLSLVPLLLLSTTILNFVLEGNESLQRKVFDSALGQFPVVGHQLANPNGVSGSSLGLTVGIVGTLFFGLNVAQAGQNAMNTIWRVPRNERPNPFKSRGRSLLLLSLGGISVLLTTGLAVLGSQVDGFPITTKVAIGLGTLALNAAFFTAGFRLATARPLTLRQTVPGAAGAAVVWQGLQYVGALYVNHAVRGASDTNGTFAVFLGLMAWLYLGSLIAVIAVEYNTVRSLKLYPRSLLTPFTDDVDLTSADVKSYTQQAEAQRFKGYEEITVRFPQPPE
ncbi:YihY/virulence factor BrkB family protein [uncultured Jatrophihabitans sp.]|uniref:YihY/virulence factor BrkB family protein n=1 Tax=uncultured Jatrophihabitans sp. TaxID=1610747 RepID=UPI0035C9F9DA